MITGLLGLGYCNSLKTIWTIWLSFALYRVHLPAYHTGLLGLSYRAIMILGLLCGSMGVIGIVVTGLLGLLLLPDYCLGLM